MGSDYSITTSEGQSYALFFALLANDKASFDKLLEWTEVHLSEGDLSTRLPAWQWGIKQNQGQILDSNPLLIQIYGLLIPCHNSYLME